jgi:VWFA-related protein
MRYPKHRNPATLFMTLAAALLACTQVLTPTSAQKAPPKPSGSQEPKPGDFVLHAQTNVVLVDVRVWDKSENPVNDLTEKDFKVFEDGTPQVINSFSLENVDKLVQASAGENAPPTVDLSKLPVHVTQAEAVRDHRLLVLFFDLSSLQPDDLLRALEAAQKFVGERVTPADLVAVVTYSSSLNIVQDFTNNRASLEKAIKGIQVGEESSYLASSGTTGEAGTTDASGNEVVTQDVSAAFTPDETEFNIFNTDEKLAAIESLSRMLRGLPGRKNVIHFSSGLERTGIENQAQLRATITAANESDVSLYTIDSRGLTALPPGGDASTASPSGTGIYSGAAVRSQVASMHSSRETLASLSQDTGGRTFYDLNDLGQAFQDVLKENSTYYLLGYSPSNTKSDGKFRHIRVEVARPGVKVQARPGYFAPKNFRQFTEEDKEEQLDQAMNMEQPFLDLPFVVQTAYFLRPDKLYDVVLAAKIPGSSVSFMKKSNARETEFDFVWRALDAAKKPAGFLRDTLPVKVSGESYDQLLEGNFLYQGDITLAPGTYQLKVVVRENITGKMGTFEEPLVLPPVNPTGLMISSVVLSNEMKPPRPENFDGPRRFREFEAARNPLELSGKVVLPSVTNVFRTNQNLMVFLESYAPKDSKNAAPVAAQNPDPPSIGLAFFKHGAKVAEAGPFPGKVVKSSAQKASYFVEIPLDKFPRGRYFMQVNVLDPAAQLVAFARVPMAIVSPPPRPAPQAAPSGK